MYKNGLSSEETFERLLRHKANSHLDPSFSRVDFHNAIRKEKLEFSAAEADFIYSVIDKNGDGKITKEEWCSIIYEDALNPL
jgi:hypothetical protein